MLVENLAGFLKDFGQPWTKGAFTFQGVFDGPDNTLNQGGVNVLSTMYNLLVQTSDVAAASLKGGDTITNTITGKSYVIRDKILVDDMAFTNLTVSF